MITISVNNQTKQISSSTSLAQLLMDLKQPNQGIAIAINQSIVSKDNWAQEVLNEGDDVLIIQATQGG
ncbi:sulfur carrier protein ThiS [Hyunsoonleella ulvae]|uniref:sulfur carrier protein ThiS n=1 Tax=Hyunsoonleella ulvae TaxID=2799948 RepID=UPI001939FD18|nr:sulfur carrier protein ThiS [Hyunsoonleella ulvae]